ncbi:hypothetical protein SpAn4DRAFT_4975 [Sporomusa ovata]|uniref:Uncharacterized protein n=1 Tax=Sporomusa ovata TaxID=2378 RepID=A0A0U1KYA0_9FIRM|nr:hypothetical protein SpAn4DRAFT_4975 [Sporomusa ovata]
MQVLFYQAYGGFLPPSHCPTRKIIIAGLVYLASPAIIMPIFK